MLDILIAGGSYPDFETGQMTQANIGVADGRIAYIGKERPQAKRTIEAAGRVVSPGFIDIHMHEEDFAGEGRTYSIANRMLEMGVTTAVGGNCGTMKQPVAYFRQVVEELGGSPIHYILLSGYNDYRVMQGLGHLEKADAAQIEAAVKCVEADLAAGAWGISFGLEYDPGITYEEMMTVARASREPGHLISVHYRDECRHGDIEPILEMIRFAGEIPQKFQISHLSSCSATGDMTQALAAIGAAMRENPRLNFDTYPYNAFSTTMGSEVFAEGCMEAWGKDYDAILLTDDPYKNVRCTKEIFDEVRAAYPEMLAVAFVMNEEEIAQAIADPNGMVASDAILNHGNGHPRAAGTFPRVLGKYVREENLLPLLDALRKMTLTPAERLGLAQKGRIRVGCDADITIFDPQTIIDRADWTHLEPPDGIDYVLIGGQVAREGKETVNGRLGRFLPYQETYQEKR